MPPAPVLASLVLSALVLVGGAVDARADHQSDRSGSASLYQGFAPSIPRGGARQGAGGAPPEGRGELSADEAAAIARRSGAKVLSVSPANGSYRVKTLSPKGRVRNVYIDRSTGRMRR